MNAEKIITYNPTTNTIEDYNEFGNGLDYFTDPTAFVIENSAYVVGGETWEGDVFDGSAVYFNDVWQMEYTDTPTTLSSKTQPNKISAFPNPSNGVFSIQGVANGTEYILIDASGATIKEGIVEGNESIRLNLKSYPNGLFFLKCKNKIIKLVKQ